MSLFGRASHEKPLVEQGERPAAPARDDAPLAENVSATGRMDTAPEGHSTDHGTWPMAKRTFSEFKEDGLTDWAAALTYYGLLALFPGVIALISILGLFGDPATTTAKLTDVITQLAPGTATDTITGPIQSLTSNRSQAGLMFFVGLGLSLWAASGYVGAFMRAANVIYETPEGRPFWKTRPLQLVLTLLVILLLVVMALGIVFTGPIVDAVAGPLGVGDTAVTVWNIAKWPVMILIVLAIFSVLYYASPNVRVPKFSLVTPGSVLALVVWGAASAGFAFYVANFGSYNKTYGTLGGLIVLLVWMWLSNVSLLLGAQLNAELERDRELKAGITDAARELQLDARDVPNHPKTT
jgi:membrane protein